MPQAVRVTNATKRFGIKKAVADVTFAVDAGTTTGLVGPNGAGKTTLFSMLAGFLRPTSGAMEVLGTAPHDVNALRGRVGVLPQDARLPVAETVGSVLTFFGRLQGLERGAAEAEAVRVLEDVGGRDWWGVRADSLSHGMAKRVAFAQALLGAPELLLLDEPTAGLDPEAAALVRDLIRKRKRRATIVVSSHDLHEIEDLCDGVLLLDSGRLVVHEAVNDLAVSGDEVHIELGANDAAAVSDALVALRALPHVTGVKAGDNGPRLVVTFDASQSDASAIMAAAFEALHSRKVRVVGMTQRTGLAERLFSAVARTKG